MLLIANFYIITAAIYTVIAVYDFIALGYRHNHKLNTNNTIYAAVLGLTLTTEINKKNKIP